MSTVSLMTSLPTEDCSRFLPPQHRTLDHRLFEDVSVAQQDPLMMQNANVVDLEDRRHGAGCHSDTSGQDPSDTEMPVLPAWKIFAVVHEASAAAGGVEAWSGHTDSHWTLIVLLHSSPTTSDNGFCILCRGVQAGLSFLWLSAVYKKLHPGNNQLMIVIVILVTYCIITIA